jgi:pilus assembly protein CpaC
MALVLVASAVIAAQVTGQPPRQDFAPTAALPIVPGAQEPKPATPMPVQPPPAAETVPPPRVAIPPFGPEQLRMPRLADRDMLGSTPKPTAKDLEEFNRFIDSVIDPRNTLDLVEGRARLILLKQAPTRIQVADESVVVSNNLTPRQLTVLGRRVGTTVLNLWFADPDNPGKEKILSYLVRVVPDPEAKERVERAYTALANEINRAFPNSFIKIYMVGDKLVVSGQAHDIAEATQILRIVSANTQGTDRNRLPNIPVSSVRPAIRPGDLLVPPGGTPGLESYFQEGLGNIVNLIRIPGEQQVMLRVVVAEVSRAAARSIGLNFSYFVTGDGGRQIFSYAQTIPGVTPNITAVIDQGRVSLALQALRDVSYARSIAEPNLIALNGQTANFFAGGEFPVPTVGGIGVLGAVQGTNFVPFGVTLNFTPYITDKDRVRLNVSAVVSTRDLAIGATIAGTSVPGLSARTFQSTVELREGQTLAVAGLIQNDLGGQTTRIPFIGDLPIIGRIASFDRTSYGDSELVILVTPELIHPLEPKELSPLPGANIFEPGDLEFYVLGRLESLRPYDYRSDVMNSMSRMMTYRRCEEKYIFGPKGFAEVP